ncbi:positive regulation of cilium movement [Tritrichomonas musculus]|uniref:Positive regulation of cilium movement n=1 Tax=Tritrichomonas musculus TaxID=1915356 RepID=A0ABR2JRZ2_9EUKA
MSVMTIANLEEYEKIKVIEKGCFGVVYLIQNKSKKKFVAKESLKPIDSNENQAAFFQEIISYVNLKYPAILSIIGINFCNFEKLHFPIIISEYMVNGSLKKVLNKYSSLLHEQKMDKIVKDGFSLSKLYIILLGIAIGMKHVHSQNIIHRDLKPDNILLDENFYPHISDFGCAMISDINLSQFYLNSQAGTPLYMAPEMFLEKVYNHKVDVYSFSLIAYELITGNRPFSEYKTVFKLQKAVSENVRPSVDMIKEVSIQNFLRTLWSNNPSDRPTFEQIVDEVLDIKYLNYFKIKENEVNKYLELFNGKFTIKKPSSEMKCLLPPISCSESKQGIQKVQQNPSPSIVVKQQLQANQHCQFEPLLMAKPMDNKKRAESVKKPKLCSTNQPNPPSNKNANMMPNNKNNLVKERHRSNSVKNTNCKSQMMKVKYSTPVNEKVKENPQPNLNKQKVMNLHEPLNKNRSPRMKSHLMPNKQQNKEQDTKYEILCHDEQQGKMIETKDVDFADFSIKIKRIVTHEIMDVMRSLGIHIDKNSIFDFYWFDGSMPINKYHMFDPSKRLNRIPGLNEICDDLHLFSCLKIMKEKNPGIYTDFIPANYLSQEEYNKDKANLSKEGQWLLFRKSNAQLIEDPLNTVLSSNEIVKKLITPFLIDSHKFELRMYAIISNLEPLTIYCYNEGIANFCAEPYETPNSENKPKYIFNAKYIPKESQFNYYRRASAIIEIVSKKNPNILKRIKEIIVLSIYSILSDMKEKAKTACDDNDDSEELKISPFQRFVHLVGVDIQIDEKGNPFIIGVKDNPGMKSTCNEENTIKKELIASQLAFIASLVKNPDPRVQNWKKIFSSNSIPIKPKEPDVQRQIDASPRKNNATNKNMMEQALNLEIKPTINQPNKSTINNESKPVQKHESKKTINQPNKSTKNDESKPVLKLENKKTINQPNKSTINNESKLAQKHENKLAPSKPFLNERRNQPVRISLPKKEILMIFDYNEGHEFEGIFNHLIFKTGGNIHDNGTIEVTTNSLYKPCHPRNLLELNNGKYYNAKSGEKNFWVCFDFKDKEIELSHYSIKSFDCDVAHIKNWVIEISNDCSNWEKIDEHSNCNDLNGRLISKTFKVKRNHFTRYCRFRHNGEFCEYQTNYYPGFSGIEFYGTLKTNSI